MRQRRLSAGPASFVLMGVLGWAGCAAPSTMTSDQFDLQKAQALADSAAAFMRQKAYGRAESQYKQALKIAGRLDPPKTGLSVFKASSDALAGLYEFQRKYDLAEEAWERLIAQMEKILEPTDADLRRVRQNLADLYVRHDKSSAARVLYEKIADSHRAAGNIEEAQRFERLAGLEPVPEAAPAPAQSGCPLSGTGLVNFSIAAQSSGCDDPALLIRSNRQAAWDDCGRTFPGSKPANISVTKCRLEPAGQKDGRSWAAGIVGTLSYDCRRCPDSP